MLRLLLSLMLVIATSAEAYDPAVSDGKIYLNNGREDLNGSIRFSVDDATGMGCIQKRIDDIWQPTSIETGATSVWVGKNVAIAGLGHHLATEAADGHLHFHAHSEFDGELSTSDVQVLTAYSFTEHMAVVPDESGEWSGTTYNYNYPSTDHRMFKNVYFKTGATAATAPVRFRVWEGADDTATLIFNQYYPSSEFPANTEVKIAAAGYLEFDTGQNYYIRVSSSETFSLKTTVDLLYPYTYGDISLVREDNLLQTAPWIDGDTWTEGDYFIDSRKLYICNTTGVQTGSFASNASLWNEIGSSADHYWSRVGTVLSPTNAGDALTVDGIASFGDGTTPLRGVSIGSTDGVNSALLLATNSNGVVTPPGIWFRHDSAAGTDSKYKGAILYDRAGSFGRGEMHFAMNADADGANADLSESLMSLKYDGRFKVSGLTIEGATPSLTYHDGTRNRIISDSTSTTLSDPDGRASISASTTKAEIRLGNGAVFTALDAQENSPSFMGSTSIGMDDSNSKLYLEEQNQTFRYYDSTRDRLKIDTAVSVLNSPAGAMHFSATNNGVTLDDGSYSRVDVSATSTAIRSETGSDFLTLDTNTLQYNDGTRQRLLFDGTDSKFVGSAGDIFKLGSLGLNYHDGTRTRFSISDVETSISSPNGARVFAFEDDDVLLTGGKFLVSPFDRVLVDATKTKISSPDGDYIAYVDNTQAYFNDGTRNRVLANGSNTELYSPDGSHSFVLGNSTANINNGTRDILKITATETDVVGPNGAYDLHFTTAGVDIREGTTNRLDIDGTNSYLISPDGNSHIQVSNAGVSITGGTLTTHNIYTINGPTATTPTDVGIMAAYSTADSAVTITVATSAEQAGRVIHIVDTGGNATTNNIAIITAGTSKINGQDQYNLTVNYASVSFFYDGVNWFSLALYE